jgi:hypothetical protein
MMAISPEASHLVKNGIKNPALRDAGFFFESDTLWDTLLVSCLSLVYYIYKKIAIIFG